MSNALNIRQLNLGDPDDFARFRFAISSLYVELFGESAAPDDAQFLQIEERGRTSTVGHWVFAAFGDAEEQRLSALVALAESFAAFAGGPYLIMGELWVATEVRRQGVGAELMGFCRTFARERGYGRIDVTAPSDPKWDRTYAFYLGNGFVPTGRKLKLLCPPEPPPATRD